VPVCSTSGECKEANIDILVLRLSDDFVHSNIDARPQRARIHDPVATVLHRQLRNAKSSFTANVYSAIDVLAILARLILIHDCWREQPTYENHFE
jgi:hypothetical protein